MNAERRLLPMMLAGLLSCAAGIASAEVTVRFVDAERYADVGASDAERGRNLTVLERHLRMAMAQCVAEDERLTVTVREVDLAGDIAWSRSSAVELRVLREVSWPSRDASALSRARPRLVCSTTPVALMTRLSAKMSPVSSLRTTAPAISPMAGTAV